MPKVIFEVGHGRLRPKLSHRINPVLSDFVASCWNEDEKLRPDTLAILSKINEFFEDDDLIAELDEYFKILYSENSVIIDAETKDYETLNESRIESDEVYAIDHIYVKNEFDIKLYKQRREILQDVLLVEEKHCRILGQFLVKLEKAKHYVRKNQNLESKKEFRRFKVHLDDLNKIEFNIPDMVKSSKTLITSLRESCEHFEPHRQIWKDLVHLQSSFKIYTRYIQHMSSSEVFEVISKLQSINLGGGLVDDEFQEFFRIEVEEIKTDSFRSRQASESFSKQTSMQDSVFSVSSPTSPVKNTNFKTQVRRSLAYTFLEVLQMPVNRYTNYRTVLKNGKTCKNDQKLPKMT